MREAIQQRRGHLGVAEHAGPFGEAQVGGDDHAGVLVQLGQQVEQQGAAGLAERQVAQFIEDDEIHPHQRQRNASGLAVALLPLQRVDQIDRGVEAHPLAVRGDAGHADGGGQMRLAGAGSADQDGVLCRLGKRQRRQLLDQGVIDLGRRRSRSRPDRDAPGTWPHVIW